MHEAAMDILVKRDVLALNTFYWTRNYFAAKTFDKLLPHEKTVGAVMVAANRCAMDEIS